MRLDPRARLCFFAALEQELGYTGGCGGPCPQLPALHHTWSSQQLERDIKPKISTGAGHSVLILLEPGRYRVFVKANWFSLLGKHPFREKMYLEKVEITKFLSKILSQPSCGKSSSKRRERQPRKGTEKQERGSLTLVLGQTGYEESALHFLLLLLRLRSHLILYWLCISHLQPQCRLLG